jgi:hypothetical protein
MIGFPATDAERGFTPSDMELLARIHGQGASKLLWGAARLVRDAQVHALEVWAPFAAAHFRPMLTILRFARSGTYAALSGPHLLATGKSLSEIVPALPGIDSSD